jgi:rod shape-determining protein MreC
MPVRAPMAGAIRRTLLAPAVALQERAELSRRAFFAHDSIMRGRDSIALRAMDAQGLASENERLRAVIGLGSRLRWGFVPAEALHGRGVRDESAVTLSAGSNAGVQRLSPVVAPEGLVGIVDNVDPTMSHALLWTNPDFRVSAMSEDGSAFGIVQAHVEVGPGKYLLEMRGVPFRTSIKPNALIVSSGLGGIYPRGIPVGRVIGETENSETWARTYLIRPAVFPSDVSSVMILKPERASEGVDNVWATGAGTDTSTRKIVTAGDSMARAAALAEARARQAVQDSAMRSGTLDTLAAPRQIAPTPPAGQPGQTVTPRPTPRSTSPSTPRPSDSSVRPATTPRRGADSARRTAPPPVAPARRDSNGLPTTL